mmetsp:Transcript_21376/g.24222  ORF Transcript_21376/g.24222 Transcript_21376/m.24222 type:complete len:113 (-) Transcript_21376:728-1066(-)
MARMFSYTSSMQLCAKIRLYRRHAEELTIEQHEELNRTIQEAQEDETLTYFPHDLTPEDVQMMRDVLEHREGNHEWYFAVEDPSIHAKVFRFRGGSARKVTIDNVAPIRVLG